jgi:hypothetical protein
MCAFGGGSCDVGVSLAECPPGTTVISGGWEALEGEFPVEATVSFSEPASNGWIVGMANNAPTNAGFAAVAVCVVS